MPLPVYVFTVNGVSKVIQFEDFALSETLNGRNTLNVSIVSNGGAYRPPLGAEVILTEDGVRIFGGVIDTPTEAGFGDIGWADIITRISATDFNALADQRFVLMDIGATNTLGALTALSTGGFLPTGVTLNGSQAAGNSLPALSYNWKNLTDVLNEIATLSGNWAWEIDYNKVLTVFQIGTRAAPYNVVTGDGHALGDIQVEPTQVDYANRVIVQFSASAQTAYAFLVKSSGNFSDGQQVTLGSKTYTFRTSPSTADDVLIGTSGIDSLAHLTSAINEDGSGTYGPGTTANLQAVAFVFSGNAIKAQARTPGAAGNSIVATTSIGGYTWTGEGSAPLTTLARGSDVALSNYAIANNTPDQAAPPTGHGLREKLIQKEDIFDYNLALAWANQNLTNSLTTPKRVRFRTWLRGFHPGQTLTITAATRNVNNTFMITDVRMKNVSHEIIESEVTAIEGNAVVADWRDVYRQWSSGGSGSSGGASISAPVPPSPLAAIVRDVRFLGGNESIWIQAASGTGIPAANTNWIPASGVRTTLDPTTRGTNSAVVRVRLRASNGTVQARLRNITTGNTVGTSTTVGTTAFTDLSFNVTLDVGSNVYELQLLPSLTDTDVAGLGELE